MTEPHPQSPSPDDETPRRITATVHACVLEFEVVYVRTHDEFQYALTPATEGVRLEELRVGQAIECVLSSGLPRVLTARVISDAEEI